MIQATQLLSDFVYQLKYDDLGEDTVAVTKMYIADYFAAAYAGHEINALFGKAVADVIFGMGGTEEASVLGVLSDFNFLHHFPKRGIITGLVFAHNPTFLMHFARSEPREL